MIGVSLDAREIKAIHSEPLAEHGGWQESAIKVFWNSHSHGLKICWPADSPSFSSLAAAYALGPARNHRFIDGKKRIVILQLAASELSEKGLTSIDANIRPLHPGRK